MWHYLYFIVLIKVKDPTEFTGPESYVHDMVKVCTGWTVNDGAFLCMCYVIMRNLDIFVTIQDTMPWQYAPKNSNNERMYLPMAAFVCFLKNYNSS